MIRAPLALLAGATLFGLSGQALAQNVSANLAVTSDYVFRGISQSDENPAFQAGIDLTQDALYVGAWVSTIDYGDGTDAEIDIYAGVRPAFGGFDWDFGLIGYVYPGQPGGADYDSVELKMAAARAVGPITVGAAIYLSPQAFRAAENEATYAELNGAFSPAEGWTISGALGRQWLSSGPDYTGWNLGTAYQLTEGLALDLRYHDTDEHDLGKTYGARVVAAVKATF